jgi:ABC-type branched-subunit amino acid transport system ATPase component
MKLVAIKDFANVKPLGLTIPETADGFVHANHVHTGFRFTIGKSEVFDDLTVPEQVTVAQLIRSKSAIIENDKNKELIAKVDAQVKAQKKLDAATKPAKTLPEVIAEAVAAGVASATGAKKAA